MKTKIDKEKVLPLVNITLASILCIGSIVYFLVLVITKNDPQNRLVSAFGAATLTLIPILVTIFFKDKIKGTIVLLYILFVFFASILGTLFSFYTKFSGYDKIMHTLFGYAGAIVGLFILGKAEKKIPTLFTVCLLCFSVSMTLGAFWEIVEFISDNFLGQVGQGVPVLTESGKYVVDISDTMLDLICNAAGALVFVIHYIVHRVTNKNLLLGGLLENKESVIKSDVYKE